jgi:hypothetical protein
MKIRFWLLSFIILMILNLAWLWRFNLNSREYGQRVNDHRSRYIQANKELYLLNRSWEFSVKSNERQLPDPVRVQSIAGESGSFVNYLNKSKKLVLVLSDRHCSTCIDQLLFLVKNEIPFLYRDRILVLFSAGEHSRGQWERRQKIFAGTDFLEIDDQSLNLPMDSLGSPYFFVTSREQAAMLSFAPYPALEAQTKEYLSLIKQKYFNPYHEEEN